MHYIQNHIQIEESTAIITRHAKKEREKGKGKTPFPRHQNEEEKNQKLFGWV